MRNGNRFLESGIGAIILALWLPIMPSRGFPAYFGLSRRDVRRAPMNTMLDRLLTKGRALRAILAPSEQQKAQQAAAARLRASGRVPINIWGDVMLDGSEPVVRRVVTGKDAHECLLSFFYLNEILTLNEMVAGIPSKEAAPDWPPSVTGRYAALRSATPDPQHHATSELLQVFLPTTLFFKHLGQEIFSEEKKFTPSKAMA